MLYHGARLLLLVGVAAIVTALFPPTGRSTVGRYSVGMVLTEPVIAEVPFVVPKSPAELQRERADAATGVPPTFDFRPEAGDTMEVRLGRFFDQLDTIAASAGDPETAAPFPVWCLPWSARFEQAALLMDDGDTRAPAYRRPSPGARQYAAQGVMEASQAQQLTAERVLIQDPDVESRRSVSEGNGVLAGREFQDRVVSQLMTPEP